MCRVMRKHAFCICVNKDTDQLCGYRAFVFARLVDVQSLYNYFINMKLQAFSHLLCRCTARVVSELVGNSEDSFSHYAAQILSRSRLIDTAMYAMN